MTSALTHPRTAPLSRGWVPVVVGLFLGLALLFVVFLSVAGTGYSTSDSTGMDAAGNVTQGAVEVQYDGAFPGATLIALVMTALLWFPPLFLCLVSPLWTARERVAAAAALPVAAIAVTALPDVGWAMTRRELGINVGAWTGLAIAVLGCGYLILRTTRVGARRATALENGAMS